MHVQAAGLLCVSPVPAVQPESTLRTFYKANKNEHHKYLNSENHSDYSMNDDG